MKKKNISNLAKKIWTEICQNTKQKVEIKPLYLAVLQNKNQSGANMRK